MEANKTDIYVYADWVDLSNPQFIGILSAHQAKGRKAFGFTYDPQWLKSGQQQFIAQSLKYSWKQLKQNYIYTQM